MNALPTRKIQIILVAVMLSVYPFCGWGQAGEYDKGVLSTLSLDQDPEKSFIVLYESVLSQVERKEVSPQRAVQADALKNELEKALIRAKAQINILRIDAAATVQDQRDILLNQIIRIAQQRERLKIIYLLRMHSLADISSEDTGICFETEKPQRRATQPFLKQSVQSGSEIKISFVPEDVTSGEHE